jgi:hypothetical protein
MLAEQPAHDNNTCSLLLTVKASHIPTKQLSLRTCCAHVASPVSLLLTWLCAAPALPCPPTLLLPNNSNCADIVITGSPVPPLPPPPAPAQPPQPAPGPPQEGAACLTATPQHAQAGAWQTAAWQVRALL